MKQLFGNHGASETALVAGDDPSVRRLTATILRQQGFRVVETRSLFEAHQRFARDGDSIALLIASLDAREDDNVLAAVLRLVRRYDQLHVILTSTSSLGAADVEIMHAVGIRFLSLPFSFGRFSRAVADYVGVAHGEEPDFLPEAVMRELEPARLSVALQ
jgi:DNA-binding NtrC family response regulator